MLWGECLQFILLDRPNSDIMVIGEGENPKEGIIVYTFSEMFASNSKKSMSNISIINPFILLLNKLLCQLSYVITKGLMNIIVIN